MKRKILAALIAICSMIGFTVIQSTAIGQSLEFERVESSYYRDLIKKEDAMKDEAIAAGNIMMQSLMEKPEDIQRAKQEIKRNLQYCLEHFDELKKGNYADIEVIERLSYALSYLYYTRIESDYDHGMKHTVKEKELWDTAVYQYVIIAYSYFSDCNSLEQEEMEYLEARRKGKRIAENLEQEVETFTEALAAVAVEAKQKSRI